MEGKGGKDVDGSLGRCPVLGVWRLRTCSCDEVTMYHGDLECRSMERGD